MRSSASRAAALARSQTALRAARLWLVAGIVLGLAALLAVPALAAEGPGERVEQIVAYAATVPASLETFPANGVAMQSDPAPLPRELRPERLAVAGTVGVGMAIIFLLVLSMLDGAVRDLGFRGARR